MRFAFCHRAVEGSPSLRPGFAAAALVLALGHTALGGPRIDPGASVSLDVAGDSNVYNGRGADAEVRLTPHIDLRLHDERNDLTLSYDLGLWWYLDGKADNSINHHGQLSYGLRVTPRLELRVADEIVRAEDPGFLIRAGVVAPQTGITDNYVEGALDARLTRRLDLAIGYSYRLTRFDQLAPPAAPLHSGDEHDATIALAYRAGRLDDLRFANRVQYLVVDGDGLAVTDGPSLGWRHQILHALELRLEGGPLIYQSLIGPGTAPGADVTAVTWFGHGLLRFYSDSFQVALTAVRDLISGTGTTDVLWADWLALQAGVRPIRELELRGSFGVFANGAAPSGDRQFDGFNIDFVAEATVASWLRLGAFYSFRWQEAFGGAPLVDVTRHIAGVRLALRWGADAKPVGQEVNP